MGARTKALRDIDSPEEVKSFVDGYIRTCTGDPEAAHSNEDDLWDRVLEIVATGHPQSSELAAAALETNHIEFARWCA